MPNYDLVLVEGFRGVGLPTIELLRAENPKDQIAAKALIDHLCGTIPSPSDEETPDRPAAPAAIVTNMPAVEQLPAKPRLRYSGSKTLKLLRRFLRKRYTRAPLTIAVQAGGESKRMDNQKH